MITCTSCNAEVDRLALFPGNICVNCYALTEEANRPITSDDLVRMWGGKA